LAQVLESKSPNRWSWRCWELLWQTAAWWEQVQEGEFTWWDRKWVCVWGGTQLFYDRPFLKTELLTHGPLRDSLEWYQEVRTRHLPSFETRLCSPDVVKLFWKRWVLVDGLAGVLIPVKGLILSFCESQQPTSRWRESVRDHCTSACLLLINHTILQRSPPWHILRLN
jgi:hypothetical protein